ncbi:hypothetical protein [uncultured Arcticibacterium sp.]|uniref:hypothetical protein n=1 Tax=uncultured Arcticibacterium sp. TaxID=2173042 RepID=UPI0030F4DC3B
MKKVLLVFGLLILGLSAQSQSLDGMLDNVLSLQKSGDKKGLSSAISQLSSGIETEANDTGGDFKEGLLSQAANLSKLAPLASKGMVKEGPLKKIINTVKLMLGANRIGNMLGGGGGLIGKASALKSGLSLMQGGSSILGSKSGGLNDLIGGAMGNVNKLDGGGLAAKAAEKALPNQLGGILSMAKGIL